MGCTCAPSTKCAPPVRSRPRSTMGLSRAGSCTRASRRTFPSCSPVPSATMALLIATALHAIATGNMLPAFVTERDGSLRELSTICVDSLEFVVSKLKDRGTHQAFGVVTNAQDFMHILKLYVERELTDRRAVQAAAQTSKAPA